MLFNCLTDVTFNKFHNIMGVSMLLIAVALYRISGDFVITSRYYS